MKIAEQEDINKSYKKVGETYFKKETDEKIADLLNELIDSGQRVRIFYGDRRTGRDFCKRYDTIGYIRRTTGEVPQAILLKDKRGFDGVPIAEQNIVKITIRKKTVYQHPHYHIRLKIKERAGKFSLYKYDDKEPLFESESRYEVGREEQIYIGNREK